ncbi:MAG: DUF4037 domain-containing protein [Treponema sp.]|jgi:hypothetical protein|nr:DUF4037 domain-containing protein [Treponema sp.]
MKHKTKLLADRFVSLLSQWEQVECVSLNEAADSDILDPYFAVILDVYHRAPVPSPAERSVLYGSDVAAFETSGQENKDRFLIGDLPVRLEFKSTEKIEELVSLADTRSEFLWLVKDSGTYGYYRLANGDTLFSRTGWIDGIKERLSHPGGDFWKQVRDAGQSKMEHYLSDLGAALIHDDDFHCLISSALFIKSACLNLFSINRCFEPSHRCYYKQVVKLPVLPESFKAQLDTFLSGNGLDRRYSLAQLIARGIIAL